MTADVAVLDPPLVLVVRPLRADGTPCTDYRRVECTCGFRGVAVPVRQISGYDVVERQADDHRYAHAHHTGFFDYQKGWVAS